MWETKDNQLYKRLEFNDFNEAVNFMNRVASLAEKSNHHPIMQNRYNVVELWLSTHDTGGITDKDMAMSKEIDRLLSASEDDVATEAIEPVKVAKMYADGGSRGNPGPSASGFVIMDLEDNIIKKSGVYLGITTNNQAEYQALKFGLEEAQKLGVREVAVFMDSMLVINQMKGIFKVKNRDLWPIHESIKNLAANFKKITYTHVPRELNKLADGEVNTTLDAELKA